MKKLFLWAVLVSSIYFAIGCMFPIMLQSEFQCSPFNAFGGPAKAHGGVVDYAVVYPHIVLFPAFWLPFSLICLAVAIDTIWKCGSSSVRRFLVFAAFLCSIIGCVISKIEADAPSMMLFEIGKSAQESEVDPQLLASHGISQPLTVAESVFVTLDDTRFRGNDTASIPAENLKALRKELFDFKYWKDRKDQLSMSRIGYMATVAGIVWMMLLLVLCAGLIVGIDNKLPEKRRAVIAIFGAAGGLALWFPHRIYYNKMTKMELFNIDELKTDFDLWIPQVLLSKGLTSVEAIPILLLLIFGFIMLFLVIKDGASKILKETSSMLGILGITGASAWALVDPDHFGKAIGISLSSPDWARFAVMTILLFFLLLVYLGICLGGGPTGPGDGQGGD